MISVGEVLADPVRKQAVVRDAAALVHAEVAAKRGLRATALKGAYVPMSRYANYLLTHVVTTAEEILGTLSGGTGE